MSFAEVVRRGIEKMVQHFPGGGETQRIGLLQNHGTSASH